MRPDNKSESFTFHRNTATTGSNTRDSRIHNCRRKLQDRFDNSDGGANSSEERNDRSVLSVLSLNGTGRAFKNGAEKISKTFSTVRTTIGSISQKFKISTKRRQILEEGPMTPNPNTTTPHTFSRAVLGRTPTKMYSPFSIESPYNNTTTMDKENQAPMSPISQTKPAVSAWQRKRNLLDDIFK